MKHWDEKIVAMMNGMKMNSVEDDNYGHIPEDPEPDLKAAFLQIGGNPYSFQETELLEGKLWMMLPRTFKPMSEQMMNMKYPSQHRPSTIYTNAEGTINIAVNHTINPLPAEDLPLFKQSMIQILRRTQKLTKWYGDGDRMVGGREAATCEFLTPVVYANLYHLMLFTSLEDRALICTFNCTDHELDDWQRVASAIMNSVRFEVHDERDAGE
ncbi:hypothetical protein [Paenibacillus sp. DCT19]|uniref:hypothetical protein n=1 Tax=Paenibacillus sp. DCT19 TaxID=2211212 RepID=UPI000FE22FDA|nr:hypothetical protein [Paenibacillus sp. DCT19]